METLFRIAVWLNKVGSYGLILAAAWGLLSTVVRDARKTYGIYLMFLSYLLGAALWLLSAVYVHDRWGWLGLILGIFLGGIGVVPLAGIAAIFHREWLMLGQLLLAAAVLFACRFGGTTITTREEERRNREEQKANEIERRLQALEHKGHLDAEDDDRDANWDSIDN